MRQLTAVDKQLQAGASDVVCIPGMAVSAGFQDLETDDWHKSIDLNSHLITHPQATFILAIRSDSWQSSGLFSGDWLLVDRAIEIRCVDKWAIVITDERLGVARWINVDNKQCFQDANQELFPDNVMVWGVVTAVIHRYRR